MAKDGCSMQGGGQPPEAVVVPIEDFLDLHAFAPSDVADLVDNYIHEASRKCLRQIRIIHGKGKGVQREMVRRVLTDHLTVVCFAEAPPEAGGWGATIVWLKP